MASDATWHIVQEFFKPIGSSDRWGDADAISDITVLRLYDFRRSIGHPVHVLGAVKSEGHTERSEHYPEWDAEGTLIKTPTAVDIVVPDYQGSAFDFVLHASRFGFTGLGYYPHWKFNGKVTGGLHLDSRELKIEEDGSIDYRHNRWMGVPGPNGTQVYVELSFSNLMDYCEYEVEIVEDGIH